MLKTRAFNPGAWVQSQWGKIISEGAIFLMHQYFQEIAQRPRMDLHKKSLHRPKTTTA